MPASFWVEKFNLALKSQFLSASKYGFLYIKNDVVKHVMPNSCVSLWPENKQRGIKQLDYAISSTFFLPKLWRFWWISDFYVANTSGIMASTWMAKWGMEGNKYLLDNYLLSNDDVTDGGWEKELWLVRLCWAEESVVFEKEGLCQEGSAVPYYPRNISTPQALCMSFISIKTEGKGLRSHPSTLSP